MSSSYQTAYTYHYYEGEQKHWSITLDEEEAREIDPEVRLSTFEEISIYSDGQVFEGIIEAQEGFYKWTEAEYIDEEEALFSGIDIPYDQYKLVDEVLQNSLKQEKEKKLAS